jgi:hypothetical protein
MNRPVVCLAPSGSRSSAGRRGVSAQPHSPIAAQVATGPVTGAAGVATAVWCAATHATCPLYIPAGTDAQEWAAEAVVQTQRQRATLGHTHGLVGAAEST